MAAIVLFIHSQHVLQCSQCHLEGSRGREGATIRSHLHLLRGEGDTREDTWGDIRWSRVPMGHGQ